MTDDEAEAQVFIGPFTGRRYVPDRAEAVATMRDVAACYRAMGDAVWAAGADAQANAIEAGGPVPIELWRPLPR